MVISAIYEGKAVDSLMGSVRLRVYQRISILCRFRRYVEVEKVPGVGGVGKLISFAYSTDPFHQILLCDEEV